MDWMDPLPWKGKVTEEDKEKERESEMGGSRCHISPTMSHSSARGNPTLIKTVINKAACCRGGALEQIKNSFWGCSLDNLVWCLNLAGWIEEGLTVVAKCVKNIWHQTMTRGVKGCCCIFTSRVQFIINAKQLQWRVICPICCLGVRLHFQDLKLHVTKPGCAGGGGGWIKHQSLRCSRLVRKRRIAFPSAQMENDIWGRGEIQLEAGVFSPCPQRKACRQHERQETQSARAGAAPRCCLCILYFYSAPL